MNIVSRTSAAVLCGFIRFYQLFLSPVLPGSCRYAPSCSRYAIDAITAHGALRGVWIAAKRIGRCHPWGGQGHDPVPEAAPSASRTE